MKASFHGRNGVYDADLILDTGATFTILDPHVIGEMGSGLLGCMAGLEARDIYLYDYGSYKGYFAENFVMQEVVSSLQQDIYCWQEGTCEIEFLLSLAGQIVPVEVKAGLNTKAKSLKVFSDRYHPQKSFLVSANPLGLKKTGLSFLPLYGVSMLRDVLEISE